MGSTKPAKTRPKTARATAKAVQPAASRPMRAGGRATEAGMSFQAEVGTWLAVQMLVIAPVGQRFGLAHAETVTALRFESGHGVDDVIATLSGGGKIALQCKTSLSVSAGKDSDFAKTITQCIDEMVQAPTLDPSQNRLVIAVPQQASGSLDTIARACDRVAAGGVGELAYGSQDERDKFHVLTSCAERTLRLHRAVDPGDVRKLAALLQVTRFDRGPTGAMRVDGAAQLGRGLLGDEVAGSAALTTLIDIVRELIRTGHPISRDGLLAELRRRGVIDSHAPGFDTDLTRVRARTAEEIERLRRFSRLPLADYRLERAIAPHLHAAARAGSFLMIGEPGAGKTGALAALAEGWPDDAPLVVFSVDQLSYVSGLRALADELGLAHDLIELLTVWPGDQPGLVVIDALDAARGGPAEAAFVRLIEQVEQLAPRWRVVASVRTFDLLNGQRLRSLMPGTPPIEAHADARASNMRHVLMPTLDAAERAAIGRDLPELSTLLDGGNATLAALFGNIFNLSLAADLVARGVTATRFDGIATQSDLIDRYQDQRLGDVPAKQAMLAALRAMVDRSTLTLRAIDFDHPGLGALLASGVVGDRDDRYAFVHHILFDHAAGRYFIDHQASDRLIEQLRSLGTKAFLLAPALRFALERFWRADSTAGRRASWNLVLTLAQGRDLGPVAAAVALRLVVEQVSCEDDFTGLKAAMVGADAAIMGRTLFQFARFLQMRLDRDAASPPALAAWAMLADHLIAQGERAYVEPARFMLWPLATRIDRLDLSGLAQFGQAARALLAATKAAGPGYRYARAMAIDFVARSWATDRIASRAAFAPLLAPEWMSTFGHEDATNLARALEHIIVVDPDMAVEIFAAIYDTPEPDDSRTTMGDSRILGLSSTKAQDFRHSYHHLKKAFRQMLATAPERAPEIVTIMSLARRRRRTDGDVGSLALTTPGATIEILIDGLDLWDWRQREQHGDADDPKIQDRFADHVASVAPDALAIIIRAACARPTAASVWRRLLGGQLAPERRSSADRLLWPIAAQPSVIESADLGRDAIDYLRAAYPTIDPALREAFEEAVLAHQPAERRRWRYMRARLLSALPPEAIVTARCRRRRADLARKDGLIGNPAAAWIGSPGNRMLRAGKGKRLSASPLDKLVASLERATKAYHRSKAIPALEALWRAIARARRNLAAMELADEEAARGWSALAEGFVALVASEVNRPGEGQLPPLETLMDVRDQLAASPYPAAGEGPLGWGSDDVRIHATRATIAMARRWGDQLPAIVPALEALLADTNASVRHNIIDRLRQLLSVDPALMWRLLERVARSERHDGVLACFVARALGPLADEHPEPVERLLVDLDARTDIDGDEGENKHGAMIAHLAGEMSVDDDRQVMQALIARWSTSPIAARRLTDLFQIMRGRFFLAYLASGDPKRPAGERARMTAAAAVGAAVREFADVKTALATLEGDAPERANLEATYVACDRMLDQIVTQLYFGSGAYRESKPTDLSLNSAAQKVAFLDDWSPILDAIETVATPHTIKYLLELYEHLLDADPGRLFERICAFVQGPAAREYYQHEQIAADDLVKFVRRMLADYGPLFDDPGQRQRLEQLLELFADAGWPEAMRLLWELPELLR